MQRYACSVPAAADDETRGLQAGRASKLRIAYVLFTAAMFPLYHHDDAHCAPFGLRAGDRVGALFRDISLVPPAAEACAAIEIHQPFLAEGELASWRYEI